MSISAEAAHTDECVRLQHSRLFCRADFDVEAELEEEAHSGLALVVRGEVERVPTDCGSHSVDVGARALERSHAADVPLPRRHMPRRQPVCLQQRAEAGSSEPESAVNTPPETSDEGESRLQA